MRLLILSLILITSLVGCKQTVTKYKEGDIVRLKPDSTLGVVSIVGFSTYTVTYSDSLNVRHQERVFEYEIFNK